MGKIFSTITDAVGLTNTKAASNAAEASAASSQAASALAADNLAFQKEQYNDWKSIYGPIQDNLASYYKNLGPEKIASMGLTAQQQEYQTAIAEIKRTNAQKGLSDSAFEKGTLDTMAMNNATIRAGIRANAETAAAQEKLKFLTLGLGQGEAMMGNINSAAGVGVNAANNTANTQMGFSNNTTAQNGAMMRNIVNEGFGYAGLKIK